MKTVGQINRENLEALIKGAGGVAKFAKILEKDPSQVSQWKNASKDSKTGKPRGMRPATCREIEEKLGKTEGWMDVEHPETEKKDSLFASNVLDDELDEFTKQLLYFFNGMSLDHKDALLVMANQLHAIDNRNDPRSNPYPVPPRGKRTVKTQSKG